MTKREFQKKVEEENLKMIDYDLVYDAVYNEPHILGCIKEGKKWRIYETDERDGHSFTFDEYDSEDAAYSELYKFVKAQIELESRT